MMLVAHVVVPAQTNTLTKNIHPLVVAPTDLIRPSDFQAFAPWIAFTTAAVTSAVLAFPPRSGV